MGKLINRTKLKKAMWIVLLSILILCFMNACNGKEEENMNDGLSLNEKTEKTEKAHVILLAGQSNASGISCVQYLKKTFSDDKISEYTNGYENIQICYYVDNDNISSEFVSVALGQGHTENHFGPEIGIAEYLSQHYPTEKFYIIKASQSGSSITEDWQESDETYNRMITGIENGFQKLEKMHLEPEWFATCWMQGESDAWDISRADNYYHLQSDLMERLQKHFSKYISDKGLSLIDAGISDNAEWVYHEKVNEAKKQYASENPWNYYLDTQAAGLTYDQDNQDHAHYDAASMIQLGQMFGDKIGEATVKQGYVQ